MATMKAVSLLVALLLQTVALAGQTTIGHDVSHDIDTMETDNMGLPRTTPVMVQNYSPLDQTTLYGSDDRFRENSPLMEETSSESVESRLLTNTGDSDTPMVLTNLEIDATKPPQSEPTSEILPLDSGSTGGNTPWVGKGRVMGSKRPSNPIPAVTYTPTPASEGSNADDVSSLVGVTVVNREPCYPFCEDAKSPASAPNSPTVYTYPYGDYYWYEQERIQNQTETEDDDKPNEFLEMLKRGVFLQGEAELFTQLILWSMGGTSIAFLWAGIMACRVIDGKNHKWLWLPPLSLLVGLGVGFIDGAIISALISAIYMTIATQVSIDVAIGLGLGQALVIVYFHLGRADFIHS